MRKIFLVLLLFSLCSCISDKGRTTGLIDRSEIKAPSSKLRTGIKQQVDSIILYPEKGYADTLINDRLIREILDNDLIYSKICKVYSSAMITRKTKRNQFDASNSDTVVTFNTDVDTLSFLKSSSYIFPLKVTLASKRIVIDHNIFIGMNKIAFKRKLGKKDLKDMTLIRDLELGNEIVFLFEKDILRKITFKTNIIN